MAIKNESIGAIPGSIRYVFTPDVLWRNSIVAIAVGCLLTLVNQLDVMLSQPFSARLAMKVFFNFLIPFVVSSGSAAINRKCD